MPLYDFKCQFCKHAEERICRSSTLSLKCTQCNKITSRQFPKLGGYHMKGDNSASTKSKNSGSFKK